jgi:hypothetical protein
VTPIEITTARANSSYWQATEAKMPHLALFLIKDNDARLSRNPRKNLLLGVNQLTLLDRFLNDAA